MSQPVPNQIALVTSELCFGAALNDIGVAFMHVFIYSAVVEISVQIRVRLHRLI